MNEQHQEACLVYVVTDGEYSDYGIRAVFSTRELAQAFIDQFGSPNDGYSSMQIENYPLDPFAPELRQGCRIFQVEMARDGTVEKIFTGEGYLGRIGDTAMYSYAGGKRSSFLATTVVARDEEHAIKIANERRICFLAEEPARLAAVAKNRESQK